MLKMFYFFKKLNEVSLNESWVKFSLIYSWVQKLRKSTRESQPWIFIGGTDAEVEAPIFWPHWKRP